jgi:hypothetical protein
VFYERIPGVFPIWLLVCYVLRRICEYGVATFFRRLANVSCVAVLAFESGVFYWPKRFWGQWPRKLIIDFFVAVYSKRRPNGFFASCMDSRRTFEDKDL